MRCVWVCVAQTPPSCPVRRRVFPRKWRREQRHDCASEDSPAMTRTPAVDYGVELLRIEVAEFVGEPCDASGRSRQARFLVGDSELWCAFVLTDHARTVVSRGFTTVPRPTGIVASKAKPDTGGRGLPLPPMEWLAPEALRGLDDSRFLRHQAPTVSAVSGAQHTRSQRSG